MFCRHLSYLLAVHLYEGLLDIHAVSRTYSAAAACAFDPASRLLSRRSLMTNLVGADVFSHGFDLATPVQHPKKTPVMLSFVNIAANREVLTSDGMTLLQNVLIFVADNMSDRGTVVVALPDVSLHAEKLTGDLRLLHRPCCRPMNGSVFCSWGGAVKIQLGRQRRLCCL